MYSSRHVREVAIRMMVLRFKRPSSIVGMSWRVADVKVLECGRVTPSVQGKNQ
jgi:hypothetical protein